MRNLVIFLIFAFVFASAVFAEDKVPQVKWEDKAIRAPKGGECPHAIIVAIFLADQRILKEHGYDTDVTFKDQNSTDMVFRVKKDGKEIKRFESVLDLNAFMEEVTKKP